MFLITCLLLNGIYIYIYIICINYHVFGDDIFSDKFPKTKWCLRCCLTVNEESASILPTITSIKNFINKYYLVLVPSYLHHH